ncbi:TetR/AcrR family transcriptional regulator [Blastococcus saxobsidens]|uniref:TetR/AcrR family transcriptional regulator n=1 Tax=Blastococcus saxobsidens TaxID=138336 RepID=A0A6L9VWV7_9ACTN|nr:TetR/AcrR family transcriptional regulator [Blastococcus saxobsidens]
MTPSAGPDTTTDRPRTVGRPRRTGAAPAGDPRQEILDAAARLFADRGYVATTMSEIARTVGLGQSSVYYWFRSKEDLLRALTGANRESLEVAHRLAAAATPPPEHLYAVLYADVLQMCRGALDFYDLERAAHAQPEFFAEILADYGRLRAEIEAVVEAGMRSGDFVPGDARTATLACLAQTEGIQHRFRSPTPDAAERGAALGGPADAARLAAGTAVRALLVDPARAADAERGAMAVLDET